MTMKLPRRLTNRRGYTIIEAIATIVIAGVVIGSALPHIDPRREEINTTINAVIGDLRFARARSITSGTHWAFVVKDAGTYEVQRLKEGAAGAWILDEVAKTNKLPSHVSLVLTQPVNVEFNTRGMMISSPNVLTIYFSDTTFGASHQVSVWPSGQIYYEL
jgi:Tfp pilus assembly protein FimT